jgi:hypothetical protein
MSKHERGRVWPALDPALFAVSLVSYALGAPLGLARVEVAGQVAAGLALDTSNQPVPFALLALRLAQLLPLGDLVFRANLASMVLAALIVLLRPPANARQEAGAFSHEPLAAAGAALAAALAFATFEVGSGAGSAAATLLLVAVGWLAAFALLREGGNASAGFLLAVVAGLAAGFDSVAGPLLWPPLFVMAIASLRRGGRWPLLAPLCYVVGWGGAGLATLAASSVPLTLRGLVAGMSMATGGGGTAFAKTALELCDELGVIGTVLAAIGLIVLLSRSTLVATWLALTMVTALFFAHPPARNSILLESTRSALPLAILTASVFAAVGLLRVAAQLGRARMAATLALAIILTISPAMDGGRGRWLRRSGLPMRLLDHALGRAQICGVVTPGTREMDGIFHLAGALGLRPDLEIGWHSKRAR